MDQGIIQNMKCYYRRDFLKKLINHEGTIQDFQSLYNIKDAVFNVACAWNSVKSETLRRAWIKLWPSVMFAEVSSDEDEFEGFKVRVRKNTLAQILEMVKDTPPSHPINKLHESELEEWVEADKEVEVTHTVTDTEIIENVLKTEKSKDTDKDSEEEDFSEEDKITWGKAASAFDTIIKFAERQPCYTAQEVMQLHILHSTFMQKRQKTCKQADIRELGKKTASRVCHRVSTDSAQSPTPSTSTMMIDVDNDDPEELQDPEVPSESSKKD
ncbi:unnamed protein product [Natator depressus]